MALCNSLSRFRLPHEASVIEGDTLRDMGGLLSKCLTLGRKFSAAQSRDGNEATSAAHQSTHPQPGDRPDQPVSTSHDMPASTVRSVHTQVLVDIANASVDGDS